MTWTVFLDYDGTLASEEGLAPNNREAILAARAAGAQVFIATGRPRCMMPEGTVEIVDGFIGSAGAYIEMDGVVHLDSGLAPETALRLLHQLENDGALWDFEAAQATYATPRCFALMQQLHESDHGMAFDLGEVLATMRVLDMENLSVETMPSVANAMVWRSDVSVFDTLTGTAGVPGYAEELEAVPSSVPGMGTVGGEFYARGVSKGSAVHWALHHLDLDVAHSVAVGDSYNDLPMLREVAYPIAVDGAPAEVLELARWTVPGPEAGGGVAEALQHVGIL